MKKIGDEPSLISKEGVGSFDNIDKAIGEGSIAVFADVKAPPFAAESELIELKIVLPSKWSSQLLERIEECIDDFGREKGIGRSKTIGEGKEC